MIIGILAKNKKLFDDVEEFFIDAFGAIDYRSEILPFDYTDYYKKEMGETLSRKFVSFKKLIRPGDLAKIKLRTNSIEEKFAAEKEGAVRRLINIDPGYITDAKLVLATTKDYSHRIYLRKGIYAEVTLAWRKGGFQALDWTYPDYRTREYIDILNRMRDSYAKQTKGISKKD
ncbi:MAG: DUF4416 family protein [Candidatus Omnitrophota bacterium]